MKKLIILAILLLVIPCYGADIQMQWDVTPEATGYKIYHSSDLGATWDAGTDVGNVTTYLMTGVLDTGIQLYRAAAYNGVGESIRFDAGIWYWGDAPMPPIKPTGIGIQ